jgi:hypothetical protein
MAPTPDGKGYWLATAELTSFHLGDADLVPLTPPGPTVFDQPTVGIAATPGAQGYWLADADGVISAYGAAHSFGSMAGKALAQPIVGITTDPNTSGYSEVAADGGVFSFNAGFYGSAANLHLNAPITAIWD